MSKPVVWDAGAYAQVASPQFSWGVRLMDRRAWHGDETVLDAGCGPGRLAEELLARVPRGRVVAVDADASMVDAARQRLLKHGSRAEVHQADLAHLPALPPADVIFSNAVLHWIEDHDAVFASFFRTLKPGGEVLVQCGGEGNIERARLLAKTLMQEAPFARHFGTWNAPWWYYDDASTSERLFIAGFEAVETGLEPMLVTFPDRSAMEAFLRAVVLNPYLRRLPDESLKTQFVETFLDRTEAAGHAWTLDYVRLNARARKPQRPH